MRISLLFLLCLMPLLVISQKIVVRGKAYRNAADYHNARDLGQELTLHDFDLKVWLVADGDSIFLNTKRHGFRNRYIGFKKQGNFYYFSADPILYDSRQYDRLKVAYDLNGWLGVACADRRLSYYNEKKRDNVLDLENGVTANLSINYIYRLVKEYPEITEEFVNDTTEVTRARLLYYLEKVNKAWIREHQVKNLPDL